MRQRFRLASFDNSGVAGKERTRIKKLIPAEHQVRALLPHAGHFNSTEDRGPRQALVASTWRSKCRAPIQQAGGCKGPTACPFAVGSQIWITQ